MPIGSQLMYTEPLKRPSLERLRGQTVRVEVATPQNLPPLTDEDWKTIGFARAQSESDVKTRAESDRIDRYCIERFSRVWRIQNHPRGFVRLWNRFLFVIGR